MLLIAVITLLALAFGVALVMPIGGADMPVVISLLNAYTGLAVAMAGFTLNNQGSFSIGSLSPGPHIVRVEPLDDADTDSFFSSTARVELNFRVMFVDRVIVVPRGGDSGSVAIAVIGK